MARLGIDFGTTNTVVVIQDRGVFSTVMHSVDTATGRIVQELFPSAILLDTQTGERLYGIEAERRFIQSGLSRKHVFIPSIKRQLRHYVEGRRPTLASPSADDERDVELPEISTLLTEFLRSLAASIRNSHIVDADESLEAVITWPANANGAQRYVTRSCFREAGFAVIDTLNEPTASAIELADCITAGHSKAERRKPRAMAVFDLGGGTFDASVVWIDGDEFHVLASSGIEDLGGDDFDRTLLDMLLQAGKVEPDTLPAITRQAILRQARSQKETISTGVIRSLMLNPADFGLQGRPFSVSVPAFYEAIRPLIRPAMDTLRDVIETAKEQEPKLCSESALTIYLVGGSSRLPLVAQMIAEAFPDSRVVLTDKPFTSVAMGAAICGADHVNYQEVFSRHFGVIRLRDHGTNETFDPIFPAGTNIPRKGEPPLEKRAYYHPTHNIGHLRYLECTSLSQNGMPDGNVRRWSDILFPYEPSLPLSAPLTPEQICENEFNREAVCEVYRCDSDGVITVELERPACGDARTYEIYQD